MTFNGSCWQKEIIFLTIKNNVTLSVLSQTIKYILKTKKEITERRRRRRNLQQIFLFSATAQRLEEAFFLSDFSHKFFFFFLQELKLHYWLLFFHSTGCFCLCPH